jgi:hypothetical protein
MNTIIENIAASHAFIELNRTFHELSNNCDESYDIDFGLALQGGKSLHWPDLIKERRLIILSEAGSGKTMEIRHIALTLREQGKAAFFLRLEYIPGDFEDAFEVGTFESFQDWVASSEEGWLLLDSVDEARLRNPGDFELAIRNVSRRIHAAKDRAHIIITGRTTAWRPKTDLDFCAKHLPYVAAIASKCDHQSKNDSFSSMHTKTNMRDEDQPVFKIVAFDDLSSDQIAVFVKARGVEDSTAFLTAVERADAWSFTARPQDLEELTEFWSDKGLIGTRLEIMRNSIDRRLLERDQDHAEARPIPTERVRQGARLLAGATTLAKDQTIRIPDGADNAKGIAVQSVLPDWNEKDQVALLSRPIFDEAIYGVVRFHHRSVREYLTAEWFAELLKRETSRRTIENLFFRNQYGSDVVVPALRLVLPWLIILDEKIRERVCKVAPEVIFEGGDPSQLPMELRRLILRKVCEQISSGATDRSMHDYAAVQRFANPDMTEDVRVLIRQYSDNEDLLAFLLRMVWIGQLAGALPEAMDVALKPTAEKYTRIVAFRAIMAIGSVDDQERVRERFLLEATMLKRDWLSELIIALPPTGKNVLWLLACLEKSELAEHHAVDQLSHAINEFVCATEIKLLPLLITGFNKLLSLPPVIEHGYCQVSEKFQWLMLPASKAVERLILARDSASLEEDILSILNRFLVAREFEVYCLYDVKTEFSNIVPAWHELNRAMFWFDVQKSREAIDTKKGERLTEYWQASIYGSFWRFNESDFEYVSQEITRQNLLENKLVALSLAFNLYITYNRPRAWRELLKKLVAGNNELSERLVSYLKPPAQSQQSRSLKQHKAKWAKQAEDSRKKRDKYHADWKKWLSDNLDKAGAELIDRPGFITNTLLYLLKQTWAIKSQSVRRTEYNWEMLIPEYGERIARFYRDSTVSFWRNYKPKLRSEGAPSDKTPYAVVIGLTGLEIEAHENKDWPQKLSVEEVGLACKYALYELNGFPTWLPKLFEIYPQIVSDFLTQEIRCELSTEKPETETYYVVDDVSWSGQWAWNEISPSIYQILRDREPTNKSTLIKLLKILQGSNMSDDLIERLASQKCQFLENLKHLPCWFAVWTGVAPDAAIAALKARIEQIADPVDQTLFAMVFVTQLCGNRTSSDPAVRQAFKTPAHLKMLFLLMLEYIKREADINRAGKGVYSPGLRDNAQAARDSLFKMLSQIPGKESFFAMVDIAAVYPEKTSRPWLLHLAKTKAEQDGDIAPWLPSQVKDFHEKLERTPNNHIELAELAALRLLDLKDDLEHGDSSLAYVLQKVTQESEMRKYIGRELREKAFGRYSIPQEEELADAKKPDLRFHGVGFDGPVPVELKLADKWTGPQLCERLANQLCRDYLRDNRSNRGVFLLVYRGKEKSSWIVQPISHKKVDFEGLITTLKEYWRQISPEFRNVDDITVIGIDLTKRAGNTSRGN